MENDITKQRVWSTMQVIGMISFAIMCTFYVTVVLLQIQAIESRLDKKIVIQNTLIEEVNQLKINHNGE